MTDGQGLVLIGRGLEGRWEFALDVEPASRGRGIGRALASAARGLVGPGESVFAQVAPGNVASVRAVLAAGFRPFSAEILFWDR
jgi:GNAT superfamily N-acetyltransferase